MLLIWCSNSTWLLASDATTLPPYVCARLTVVLLLGERFYPSVRASFDGRPIQNFYGRNGRGIEAWGVPKYTGPWCASRLSMPRASFIWNAAAASIAGFVCGAALWLQQHPKPAVPAVAPPVTGVLLRVQPEGRPVQLSWNRDSET